MPPPRVRARQALVDQAVQRDRDRRRLVPPRARTPRPEPASNGYTRSTRDWNATPYYVDTNGLYWGTLVVDDVAWLPITNTNTYQYTTGSSTTLVYNQPWTWTGNTGSTVYIPTYTSASTIRVPRRTPEEEAAIRRHREEVRAAGERDRLAALDRSYDLLDELLSEEQRREFRARRRVTVEAPSGNRYALIAGRHAGNVHMWHPERREWSGRLCVHISETYPDGDNLAAQMLAIQTDEATFLGTANVQDGTVPPAMLALRETYRAGVRLDPQRAELIADVLPQVQELAREVGQLQQQLRTGVAA